MAKRSLALLFLFLACSAVAFAAPPSWSSDAQLSALGERVPGFGGAFVGSDGRLAVYLQNPATQRATFEKAAGGGANILKGDYEFRDLVAWKAALRPLLSMPGVTSLDANEMINRVQVGIDPKATAAQRADVEARLASLGVPAAAVRFAGQTAMSPMPLIVRASSAAAKGKGTTVQSRFVPFPAGVQINWRIDTQFVGICTVGFVAKQGASTGLVTNRHCTNVEGAVDRTHYRQGGFSDPFVATEVKDPGFFTGGDCPVGRRCRNSDSVFAKLDGKSNKPSIADLKKIVKPTKASPTRGPLSVSPATARFTIVGREGEPLEGEIAHKVGRTTGETFGPIIGSCIDVNVSDADVTNLCQTVVQGGSDHGDSGSPVFVLNTAKGSSSTPPPVRAVGIMWGGGQLDTGETVFVYSPLGAVDFELGPVGVN